MKFQDEWRNFNKNPSDPISALRVVHAAFRVEQEDSVINLLLNPILIDSAPLLVSLVEKGEADITLAKWAEVLEKHLMIKDAVQIIEDSFTNRKITPHASGVLCRLHYGWAQYTDPTTGVKATPEVRIKHLNRLLELGLKNDYIYKFLAEAYHDSGDDEQARAYLNQAFQLNPKLLGAVRISRALGMNQITVTPTREIKSLRQYKYHQPEQIPSSAQIYELKKAGDWDSIIEYANPNDYSPRIISKARHVFYQIASALGNCSTTKAKDTLLQLLEYFHSYWDVNQVTVISLSRIGDKHTLEFLKKYKFRNPREQAHLETCLFYLQARLNNQLSLSRKILEQELFSQAEKAYGIEKYGEARLLLENFLTSIAPSIDLYYNATILLARSCAKMSDTETALELIWPIFTEIPEKLRLIISQDATSWLWNNLITLGYMKANDKYYQLTLDIYFNLAVIAKTPEDVLENLRILTRWLELLGVRDTIQWIRQLIRTEVPGSWYVERVRDQYIRAVDLSENMREYLASFDKRIKSTVTARLKKIMKSPNTLDNAEFFLDNH